MVIASPTAPPSEANSYHNAFVTEVVASLARVADRDLIQEYGLNRSDLGREVFFGNFALLCHRGDVQPLLIYGNQFVLNLWECNWEELIKTHSSATAPADDIASRKELLQKVERDNFVAGYSGRRVSFTGRLFLIQDVTVWRMLDKNSVPFGAAAFFPRYQSL